MHRAYLGAYLQVCQGTGNVTGGHPPHLLGDDEDAGQAREHLREGEGAGSGESERGRGREKREREGAGRESAGDASHRR